MSNKLFKGKYVISIYELGNDDTCLAQFDNVEQLAKYINRPVYDTTKIVNYHFRNRMNDKPRKIYVDNSLCEIAFIAM